jgi:hypothetical protein
VALSASSAVARSTANTGSTTTTASFTPASGVLLVACVGMNTASQTAATVTVSGGSLTWTERAHADHDTTGIALASGVASIWTAVSAGASMTVTAAGGPNVVSVQVYAVSGQAATPTGATGIGRTTTASSTISAFTSTGANSMLFWALCDWAQTGAPTSSDTTGLTSFNVSGEVSGGSAYKTLGGTGPQTFQVTTPGAPDAVWAAIEVMDGGGAAASPPQVVQVRPAFAAVRAATW